MSHGSTLIATPCGLRTKDHTTTLKQTKLSGMKRRNSDRAVLSCLSRDVLSTLTAVPTRKKFRRCLDSHARPSEVSWGNVVNCISDSTLCTSNHNIETENVGVAQSTDARNEKWYSKAEYKQMMLDQCLTVHIMRSLRSLTGEKVPTDYCDEIDCSTCRFDELIKKHSIDPEEYCERGLESYLSNERRHGINASRKLHKFLVIGEYDRQSMTGTFDFELVRNASLTHSKKSLARARKLALIDQREAQAGNKLDKPNNEDYKQDVCERQIKRQDISANSTQETKILVNENQFSSEAIREALIKQQLIHLLRNQERELNQRAQSQYDFNQSHLNSITASLNIQEQEQLFHLNHKQQKQEDNHNHRHQLQLHDQCNYQHQVQRLLLLQQHQQHYDAVQLASAAILGQCHRR